MMKRTKKHNIQILRKKTNQYFSFFQLFHDEHVMFLILQYCTYKQVGKLIQTCKKWGQVIKKLLVEFTQIDFSKDLKSNCIQFCTNGYLDGVKYLIQQDISISTFTEYTMSLIAGNGHLPIIEYLFPFNQHLQYQQTISSASSQEHWDIVKFLISKGMEDVYSYAIYSAVEKDNLEMVKYLVLRHEHIGKGYYDQCFVNYKNDIKHSSSIQFLISKIEDKNTYLYLGCRLGNLNLVKYLISQGTDIQKNANELLCLSFLHGHFEVGKYLIEQGADFTMNDHVCLVDAIIQGYFNIVEYLLSLGSILPENKKKDALMFAIDGGYLEIFKLLISHGMNIENLYHSLYEYANEKNQLGFILYLKSLTLKMNLQPISQ